MNMGKGSLQLIVECLLPRRSAGFPYMRTFAEAWMDDGGASRQNFRIPRRVRSALGHLGLCFRFWRAGRKMLCLGSGRIESVAWPWCYAYEIVPVMWDVWPEYVEPLCKFIRRNRVRLVFCTSRQQTELLRRMNPQIRVEWMPEGVDVGLYPRGEILKERPYDVVEYGRVLLPVHEAIKKARDEKKLILYYPCEPGKNLETLEELARVIRSSKISICYPQCDTNPQRAGGVETLTQRYWEAMLSGTLILGRAPRELIDFCGYNPVIDLDKTSEGALNKVQEILEHIEDFQELADRNERFARENAPWAKRMPIIVQALQELN